MLIHPGPADPQRVRTVACRAHPLRLLLRAGVPLDRAIAQAVRAAGFGAAWLSLRDLPCDRLAFVIPAPPPGDGRVAYYSRTHRLGAGARIVMAGLHLGQGGAIHAHGLWIDRTGTVRMGHLRPDETSLSHNVQIEAWGIDGAAFCRGPDSETGFALFTPRAQRRRHRGGQAARLVRLRPHLDLVPTLRRLARPRSRILGLGSLIGTRFADAAPLPGPATEILITGQAGGQLRIASVGEGGDARHGWLQGPNRVCITAELLLIDAP